MADSANYRGIASGSLTRRSLLRGSATLGAAALGAPILAACSAGAAAPAATSSGPIHLGTKPITLSMWTWDPNHIKFFKSQQQRWNADPKNPHLTLTIQQIDPSTAATKLLASITAGSGAPDLAAIAVGDIPIFFANGSVNEALVDLNGYIAGVRDQFSASKWAAYSNKGQTYAVESTMGPSVLYYRRDEFARLGINPQFATIDDWLAAVKHVAKSGKYLIALDVGGSGYPEDWIQWFVQHGGNVYDAQGHVVFDQGGHAEAVTELYVSLLKQKLAIPLPSANGDALRSVAYKNGSLIATFGPDWWGTYIIEPDVPSQSGQWEMAELPLFGQSRSSTLGGAGFAITKPSPNPDAAYAFLAFSYLTLEGQIDKWKEIQYFPTMMKAWTDPSVTQFTAKYYDNQKIGAVYATAAAGEPLFFTAASANQAQTIICNELINPAADGSRSIADGIKIATEQIKSAAAQSG